LSFSTLVMSFGLVNRSGIEFSDCIFACLECIAFKTSECTSFRRVSISGCESLVAVSSVVLWYELVSGTDWVSGVLLRKLSLSLLYGELLGISILVISSRLERRVVLGEISSIGLLSVWLERALAGYSSCSARAQNGEVLASIDGIV